MNLSPINYQPMLASQQQKVNNAEKQNFTVNFKGYVGKNVKLMIREYARTKFKFDKKAEKECRQKLLNELEEIAKLYPDDVYIDRRQYACGNKVVGDLWVLGHKKLPTSQYELAESALGDHDPRFKNLNSYGYFSSYPEKNLEHFMNYLFWHGIIPNAKAGKGNAELFEVVDQLAKQTGNEAYYKENLITRLKNDFNINDAKENLSIGRVRRTENAHYKRVYDDDKRLFKNGDREHIHLNWKNNDKIKYIPGFLGWIP